MRAAVLWVIEVYIVAVLPAKIGAYRAGIYGHDMHGCRPEFQAKTAGERRYGKFRGAIGAHERHFDQADERGEVDDRRGLREATGIEIALGELDRCEVIDLCNILKFVE